MVGVDEVGVRLRVLSVEHGEERYEDTFQVRGQENVQAKSVIFNCECH